MKKKYKTIKKAVVLSIVALIMLSSIVLTANAKKAERDKRSITSISEDADIDFIEGYDGRKSITSISEDAYIDLIR